MTVVADTSPLNYLVLIDEIEILPQLFDRLLVPKAVWDELSAPGSPDSVKAWVEMRPAWINVESPKSLDSTIKLGTGEIAAISLAGEIGADLLLVDDRKARMAAIDRGLNVAGTINLLEAAANRGLLDLSASFQSLQRTNFRISPALLSEILMRYQ